jgi:RNA polymerase sigma-70 factor (ECF subfamily)
MDRSAQRLRTPEERVGMLPNASLPPPARDDTHDALLLRALVERDENAFAQCVDRLYPSMLRFALQHVRDEGAAEEVVQETWLAALDAVARFEGRASVKTWLFHILRNIARQRGRRDARFRPLSDLSGDATETNPLDVIVAPGAGSGHAALWGTRDDPERDVLLAELQTRLDAAIAKLPPRLREVLVLVDVDGFSTTDVCNIMGISSTNQRVMLHRARDRVRNELRDYLGSDQCGDEMS